MKPFWVALLLGCSTTGFSQLLSDSSMLVVFSLEQGESQSYQYYQRIERMEDSVKSEEIRRWTVEITLLEKNSRHFILQWNTKDVEMAQTVKEEQKVLIELMEKVPVVYETDSLGRFNQIVNWEAWRDSSLIFYHRYFEQFPGIPDSTQLQLAARMASLFQTQQQVEYWQKPLLQFHRFFGDSYSLVHRKKDHPHYTHPDFYYPVEGYGLGELTNFDFDTKVATVKAISGIEWNKYKTKLLEYVKENGEALGIENWEALTIEDMPYFQVTEYFELQQSQDLPQSGIYLNRTEKGINYEVIELRWKLKY